MTTEIDYAKCLVFLNPNAEWALNGNDYSTLEWLSDDPKPTEAEIIAAWSDAKAAYDAKLAARAANKAAILERLGITETEAKLILQ